MKKKFFVFILFVIAGCTTQSNSPTSSNSSAPSGPPAPDYFTLTYTLMPYGSMTWTDSTPTCYTTAYGPWNLGTGVVAYTRAEPPAETAQQMLFAILFENSWGHIPTGVFSDESPTQEMSVQLLSPDGSSDEFADSYTITVSRVDNTGIYGTITNASFQNGLYSYSGSFHVPAPQ